MIILEHLTGPYMSALWIVLAVLLLLVELGTPGLFFFVSFATGCVVAALCSAFELELSLQLFIGLMSAIVQFFYMRSFLVSANYNRTETNVHALIGKHAIVTHAIPGDGFGVVVIGSESWRARSVLHTALQKHDVVTVVAVSGNHVVVTLVKTL